MSSSITSLMNPLVDRQLFLQRFNLVKLPPPVEHPEYRGGYQSSVKVFSAEKLADTIRRDLAEKGPHLIHVKVKRGSESSLGHPTVTPVQVKERFMKLIGSFRSSQFL